MVALLKCLWIAEYFLPGPVNMPLFSFRSYIQFEIQISNGLHFCFVFPVHQLLVLNTPLRAVQVDTEESHLMTLDRCIACKNQLKTPVVAVQAGSPLPISLDQLWEFREGRRLPNSHSPSLNSVENNLS